MTIDHVQPKSTFTGEDVDNDENLCAACRICNAAKAAMSTKEFRTFVNTRNNELLKLESDRRHLLRQAEAIQERMESARYNIVHHMRKSLL